MQADCEMQNEIEILQEDTEHLNNLKNLCQVENENHNSKVDCIDREFQKLLCQLTQSKIQENALLETRVLIKRLSATLLLQVPKGPQILFTLYQILLVRKPTIKRNLPFSPLSSILTRIRKLLRRIKEKLLNRITCFQDDKERLKQLITYSSFHPYALKQKQSIEKSQPIHFMEQQSTASLKLQPIKKRIIFIKEPMLI